MFVATGDDVYRFRATCQSFSRSLRGDRPDSTDVRALDRIGDIDEFVLDGEPLGEQLAEPADPKRLRRIVAACEEVDAVLPRLAHHGLRRFAGDQGIQAQWPGLVDRERAAAGHDPDAR